MKTIKLSDEDYYKLMELSRELQLQTNNGQAFPYFWEPSSEKLEPNINNEGDVIEVYDSEESETFSLQEIADDSEEELWSKFLKENEIKEQPYTEEHEKDFTDYLVSQKNGYRFYVHSSDWKRSRDHNPSLFLSDVKQYCKSNTHHLGRKPAAYSDSIFRMPKMQNLVEIIYRINPQPEEEVNHEARRFVYKKEDR